MGVDLIVLQQLAVSFGLGLLLGLQRERVESSIGGIRTFPLIAIFGTICALLGKAFRRLDGRGRFARARGDGGLLEFRQDEIGRHRSGNDDGSCSFCSMDWALTWSLAAWL